MRYFDPHLLQTLVAFADAGTLAQAAQIVGRTPSAITTQMQRLEAVAGVALFKAVGRRRILTEAGEQLLIHARRILSENHEAWMNMSGVDADGSIGLGITQDFVDVALPGILNQFARTHPRVRMNLRVGRSAELLEDFKSQKIDILVSMRHVIEANEMAVTSEQMQWFCAKEGLVRPFYDEIPLAVLDRPCGFRDAAIKALGDEGKAYRIAATSPSLSGVLAPVRAGLAVTVRTARWADESLRVVPKSFGLPVLNEVEFSVRIHQAAHETVHSFAEILSDGLGFK